MGIYLSKTKKFGCVGRGDRSFLFISKEINRSQNVHEKMYTEKMPFEYILYNVMQEP